LPKNPLNKKTIFHLIRIYNKQKGRFCIAAKTPFFVVSNEKNADIA